MTIECCRKLCRKPLRFFISHNLNRKYVFNVKVDKLLALSSLRIGVAIILSGPLCGISH